MLTNEEAEEVIMDTSLEYDNFDTGVQRMENKGIPSESRYFVALRLKEREPSNSDLYEEIREYRENNDLSDGLLLSPVREFAEDGYTLTAGAITEPEAVDEVNQFLDYLEEQLEDDKASTEMLT